MPALPPFVSPEAFVVVVAFCVACAVRLPRERQRPPVPTDAVVVMFEIAIAACAASATVPLPVEAPPSAVVVIASVLVGGDRQVLGAVQHRAVGSPAVVVSLTTLTATEMPTPLALPSVSCFATARAPGCRVRGRAQRQVDAVQRDRVVPSTSAVVSATTTLTAIEPATPTLLPPAPEIELAP